MHSAVLKKVKYHETMRKGQNIYGYKHLYKICPKFQMQDIRRIIFMGHLFQGVTSDTPIILLMLTVYVSYSYCYTKITSEGEI